MGNTPVIGPHRPRSAERFDTSCDRTDGVCKNSLQIQRVWQAINDMTADYLVVTVFWDSDLSVVRGHIFGQRKGEGQKLKLVKFFVNAIEHSGNNW
jgi:hypothetical protein